MPKQLNLEQVKRLLESGNLPTSDLTQDKLSHFVGLIIDDEICGVVGLEPFPPYGLLRSLVIADSARAQGNGIKMLKDIERYAKKLKVQELYLLTTTAEKFFARNGYKVLNRKNAPKVIQTTSEFSSVCPASATIMMKHLK